MQEHRPAERGFRARALIALLLAAALLGLLYAFCPVRFETNDDTALMQIVSGARTGEPYPYDVYNNVCYTAPLSLLYRLIGGVPFYTLFQLALIVLSVFVLFRSAFDALDGRGRFGAAAFAALLAASFAAVYAYAAVILQYSVTAAFCGAAACARLYSPARGGKVMRALALFAAVLLALTSFLLRAETGAVTLLFLFVAALLRLPENPEPAAERAEAAGPHGARRGWFTATLTFLLALALCGGAALVQRAYESAHVPADYAAFNRARTAFNDYAHPSFDDDPALYASVGWTGELAALADEWFLMDDRIDAQSLSTAARASGAPAVSLSGAVKTFAGGITGTNLARNAMLAALALFALAFIQGALNRDRRRSLGALLVAASFFGCVLYLCARGRFPLRSLYVCAFPACALSLVLIAGGGQASGKAAKRASAALTAIALCAVAFVGLSTAKHVYALANFSETAAFTAQNEALDAYVTARPDDVFVTDVSLTHPGDPFASGNGIGPINRFFWGGWYRYTPMYDAQLAANGLTELTAAQFYDARVHYVSASDELPQLLLDYLTAEYGQTRMEAVDATGDGFTVYQFTSQIG